MGPSTGGKPCDQKPWFIDSMVYDGRATPCSLRLRYLWSEVRYESARKRPDKIMVVEYFDSAGNQI